MDHEFTYANRHSSLARPASCACMQKIRIPLDAWLTAVVMHTHNGQCVCMHARINTHTLHDTPGNKRRAPYAADQHTLVWVPHALFNESSDVALGGAEQ